MFSWVFPILVPYSLGWQFWSRKALFSLALISNIPSSPQSIDQFMSRVHINNHEDNWNGYQDSIRTDRGDSQFNPWVLILGAPLHQHPLAHWVTCVGLFPVSWTYQAYFFALAVLVFVECSSPRHWADLAPLFKSQSYTTFIERSLTTALSWTALPYDTTNWYFPFTHLWLISLI